MHDGHWIVARITARYFELSYALLATSPEGRALLLQTASIPNVAAHGYATSDDLDVLIRVLEPTARRHLLDLGCGLGGMAIAVHQQTGVRVTGIDISARAVAVASARAIEAGIVRAGAAGPVAFVRGSIVDPAACRRGRGLRARLAHVRADRWAAAARYQWRARSTCAALRHDARRRQGAARSRGRGGRSGRRHGDLERGRHPRAAAAESSSAPGSGAGMAPRAAHGPGPARDAPGRRRGDGRPGAGPMGSTTALANRGRSSRPAGIMMPPVRRSHPALIVAGRRVTRRLVTRRVAVSAV